MRGNNIERLIMRIRKDSPFHGITELQKEQMLDAFDKKETYDEIAEGWEQKTGIETTGEQVRRFLQRVRYERAIREVDDSPEDLTGFAERARDGKARDGLIEASRQKLFEEALAKGNNELLLELYRAANEERAREREVAVEQRKAAVAEENAMIGWAKIPGGRPIGKKLLKAEVASSQAVIEAGGTEEVKLLPKVREALMDLSKKPEERLAAALEFLESANAADGAAKLLAQENGAAAPEAVVKGNGGGEEKEVKAPKPTIDWDAPLKELIASKPFAHLYPKENE